MSSKERKKFSVVADETLRAEEAAAMAGGNPANGNLSEYRIRIIERWIVQHEEDDDLEHADQRKNIARIDNSITWWLGAAAASGTILGIVGTVLMAIFVWALGLVRFGGG